MKTGKTLISRVETGTGDETDDETGDESDESSELKNQN